MLQVIWFKNIRVNNYSLWLIIFFIIELGVDTCCVCYLSLSLRAAVSAVRCPALSRRSAEPFRPVGLATTAVADAVAAGAAAGAGGTSATGNGTQRHASAQQRRQHQLQRAATQHRDKHSHNREQPDGLPQLPVPPHTVRTHTHTQANT